jgi:hypothetical protein
MNTSDLWEKYLQAFSGCVAARMALHGGGAALVEAVRRSLWAPGEIAAALSYVPYLPQEEALLLIDPLIAAGLGVHGMTRQVWQTLVGLPRVEVVTALAHREQGIVEGDDYEALACLLELWVELGERGRAIGLAERALHSADEDVRDSAARFLEKRGASEAK